MNFWESSLLFGKLECISNKVAVRQSQTKCKTRFVHSKKKGWKWLNVVGIDTAAKPSLFWRWNNFFFFSPHFFSKAVKISFHMPILAYRYLVQTKVSVFLCLSCILQSESCITALTRRDGNRLLSTQMTLLAFSLFTMWQTECCLKAAQHSARAGL